MAVLPQITIPPNVFSSDAAQPAAAFPSQQTKGLIIVTNKVREFERVEGLGLEN